MKSHPFEPHAKMGNVCRHCRGPRSDEIHIQPAAKVKRAARPSRQQQELLNEAAKKIETRQPPSQPLKPSLKCKHGEDPRTCINCEYEENKKREVKRPLPEQNRENMFLSTPVQQYFRGLTIPEAQKLHKGDKLFFRSIRNEALPCAVDEAPELSSKDKNAVVITLRRKYNRRFDFGTEVWRYDAFDIVDNRLLTEVSKNGKR